MDDDDEFERDDESDSLDLGSPVIVHTDDGYETGILLSAGESGVRLRVTHRVSRVGPSVSKAEKAGIEAVVAGMKARELRVVAMELLGVKSLLLSRKLVDETVVEHFIEKELENRPTVETLVPMTRSVHTFLPWDRVAKIVSFTEWEEEMLLRPMEASLAEKADG